MRTLSLVMGILCLFTVNTKAAQAKSADAFFKRFQVVRSADGKLVGIRDRTLPVSFSVAPYVKLIRSQLLEEQSLMSSENLASGQYDSEIKSVIEEGLGQDFSGNQDQFDENVQVVVDSLKN